MAKGFRLKLNRANVGKHILKGDGTAALLLETGRQIAQDASADVGEGAFECVMGEGGKARAHAFVQATTYEAGCAEAVDKALTKAVMGR